MDFLLVFIELFFTRCYGWGATSEYGIKIGEFTPTGTGWPNISGRRSRPLTNHFSSQKTTLSDLSYIIKIWTQDSFFCHESRVWQTNRRTDTDGRTHRILIARPRPHFMQSGENYAWLSKISILRCLIRYDSSFRYWNGISLFSIYRFEDTSIWHTFISFTEFTEFAVAVNENTAGINKHRLSPYNSHYLTYNFLTEFPVPVPYEYEI